jgi:hypothetical protein
MTRKKIDWLEAKKEYIADTSMSYRAIAEKYGVARKTVQERGTREKWPEQRQDVAEEAFDNFRDNIVEKKAEAQERHLKHYKNLQALANKAMAVMADENNPLVLADLEKLARSLKLAIDGERVVLGIPTSVAAVSDPQGDDVWSGLAALIQQADEVLEEHGEDL